MKKLLYNNILLLILILVLAYGIMQLAFQNRRLNEMIEYEKIPVVGEKAYLFKAKDLNGKDIQLGGANTLLIFFDTQCGICERSVPEWKKLAVAFAQKPVQIVAISANEPGEVRTFIENHQLDFPTVPDPSKRIFYRYKIKHVPLYVLVNKEGKIVYYRNPGEAPEKALQKVKSLLQNL
ncbi:MAG: TlpA disulfide reductase family protein [candidate division KSB1 bacterium]|nr:TlpA disulfide reductase family protein [candidate division KSB1 bacterium]MDQ7065781.1 TlpA disulfide reductase family protein [candidate division KSB1 bacterium]